MEKCTDDLKVAFVTLSRNPIMIYAKEIDEYNLATLQKRYWKAWNAVQEKKDREALVLTGLFSIANVKGNNDNIELELSSEAKGTFFAPSEAFHRFRQLFVGSYAWIETKPEDWTFDANYVRRAHFDNLTYVQEFIESLFLLIQPCDNEKSAWRSVATPDGTNEMVNWRTVVLRGFTNVCERIFEKDLKRNQEKIKKLIY